ncbi:MAG: hypothetical protein HC768_20265 [Acaryochloris sp. CRU_2_0]|nr:hypothetical protein [Acaryochloris sp. CRU_2_0]
MFISGSGGLYSVRLPLAQLSQAELDEWLLTLAKQGISRPHRAIEAIYPLTSMQQGLLFHSTYAPDSGVYIEQFQLTLNDVINVDAFQQSCQHLVTHHSVLRTCFIWERSQPLQVILKSVKLPWQSYDWQHLSIADQQQQLQQWLQQDRQAGFDVSEAPLTRFTLIQLGPQRYQFIWTFHHVLLDGWSLPILMQELLNSYEATVQGQSYRAVYRRPYQDYVAWLLQQDKSQAESYWRQQLAGFTAPTSLPIQRVRTASPKDFAGEYHEQVHCLSAELTAAVQSWQRRQRLSLATVIYGVWGMLLSRYSGETDVVFGVTVSGRSVPLTGIEEMVGLLINTPATAGEA